jgi:hypothetical protein
MTLEQFTEMTLHVVLDDGMGDYLPTLLYPDTQEVRAIEGIPAGVDHRQAIQDVARRSSGDKRQFFFGVCTQPGQIVTGHFRPGRPTQFMQVLETTEGYSALPLQRCDWWTIL